MSGSLTRQCLCLSCLKVNHLGWEGRIKLQWGWGLVGDLYRGQCRHRAPTEMTEKHGSVGVPCPPRPPGSRDQQLTLTCPSLAHPAPHLCLCSKSARKAQRDMPRDTDTRSPWVAPTWASAGSLPGSPMANNVPPAPDYGMQVLRCVARP